MQIVFIRNWSEYFRKGMSKDQEEFWLGELKAFLKDSTKEQMLMEHGELSLRGRAYGRVGFCAGEVIVTSPVRLLRRMREKKVLVKTATGCVYVIREDGYDCTARIAKELKDSANGSMADAKVETAEKI